MIKKITVSCLLFDMYKLTLNVCHVSCYEKAYVSMTTCKAGTTAPCRQVAGIGSSAMLRSLLSSCELLSETR